MRKCARSKYSAGGHPKSRLTLPGLAFVRVFQKGPLKSSSFAAVTIQMRHNRTVWTCVAATGVDED